MALVVLLMKNVLRHGRQKNNGIGRWFLIRHMDILG